MINASQEFKNLVKKGAKLVNYADITLKDGTVLNLGPSDFSVGGFSMSDKTSSGKFEVGTTIGKTIRMTIANHTNKFSAYDFFKAIIYVYVAIEKTDGTVLKERKGKYYVINPTTPSDTIRLDGVDSMYLFDKDYEASTAFPATLQTILSDCCIDCGVSIGFGEFDNWDFVVMHKPTDCTYRQVVSWVAQIAGYNARINNSDYLELVWYEKATEKDGIDAGNFFIYQEDIIDGGDFTDYSTDSIIDGGLFTDEEDTEYIRKIISLSVSTDDVIITGAKVEFDNVVRTWGSDEYMIVIKNNPLVEEKEQEIANYIGQKVFGLYFRPMTCTIPNNPLLEAYDTAYIFDRKGNTYFSLLNNIEYSISGSTKISCVAEDPVRNESSYVSESAKAVVQAKRNTEKQITTYDKAVQNMNALASSAMGLYRESETQLDGSVIYYMSNRPIVKDENGTCVFEENSVVYKMTGDGFFVSEDGGLSYTSGFDSEGNAVVNVLSAIGITFDWARGGTLSLGGDNDINGSMVVYDSENNIVGKFNKDGLWASNGYFKGDIVSTNAYITGGTIQIKASGANYNIIELSYKSEQTLIHSNYIKLINGTNYNQITSSLISMNDGIDNSYLNAKKILFSNNIKTTSIGVEEASFAGEVFVFGDLYFYGTLRGVNDLNVDLNVVCTKKGNFANGLNVGGTSFTVDANGKTYIGGGLSTSASYTNNLQGDCKLGSSYSKVGFFGSSGSSKKTVSTINLTSNATANSNATKINEIINALKAYNLL